ncbi:MAG: hypothetical protein ACFFDT_16295 [Candidatus Hodarchaeota archaeon]
MAKPPKESEKYSIMPLFQRYCQQKGWQLLEVNTTDYVDPELITHILQNEDEQVAVKLLNWDRSVGTDQAIRLQRFCELNSISGILVAKMIGENTLQFCSRHGIVTLSESDLQAVAEPSSK